MGERDAAVQEPGHRVLVLHLLDDQLDIEIVQRTLEIGRREPPNLVTAAEEGPRIDLDEAEGAVAEADKIQVEIGHVVEREAVAERRERIERA